MSVTAVTKPRPSVLVDVRCSQCGDVERISERWYRTKQAQGTAHRCRLCRSVHVRQPTSAHYNYWLERYTLEEIQDLARAIWG